MTAPANGQNISLLSPGMTALLTAQFLSALADNAVLIIAIALVRSNGVAHQAPLLQGAFVAPFILLAPFAGPVADGYPKGRVMLLANTIKLAGAAAMAARVSPPLAYGLIGIGATLYSPAKYGILTQLVDAGRLVRANGVLEASTIVAILLGVLAGGRLTDRSATLALLAVIAFYALACAANLFIPKKDAERPLPSYRPGFLIAEFASSVKTLFANPDARFSLLGTSIFWGSGVTLRLLLFAWAPAALFVTDYRTPANLMGMVSLGIVLGATLAGIWISLTSTNRALAGGLLLGPAIFEMAAVSDIRAAAVLLVLVGLCGGLFVVPMNALLQESGHLSVGAGNALAVQNFGENIFMLLFLAGYSASNSRGVPVMHSVRHFGQTIFFAMAALAFFRIYAERFGPCIARMKKHFDAVRGRP